MRTKVLFSLVALFGYVTLIAQGSGTVRGYVYDSQNGAAVHYAEAYLEGTTFSALTNAEGFYAIPGVPKGEYVLTVVFLGYDTFTVDIKLKENEIKNEQILLTKGVGIKGITIGEDRAKTEDVNISTIPIKIDDLKRLPSVGGEADLAQYLQMLPGVVSSGDQGGQLFIRGGAPVHNKILLDNMSIFNAFHSVGLFSVYETEIIRNVDVKTGGFNAEYGGRISAVIDVQTREGNKQRFSGRIAASPFVGKVILEGPISKLKDDGSSISYLLTTKQSYLKQTAPALYSYVPENPAGSNNILPYNFTDAFGKISLISGNGSRLNLMGFNFRDKVDFDPIQKFNWNSYGGGADFTMIPGQSKSLINGRLIYTDYKLQLEENDDKPRQSRVNGINIAMNLTYFLPNDQELQYGIDFNTMRTEFSFFSSLGFLLDQNENTTEFGGFLKYQKVSDKFIVEPGFRIQYYASLNAFSPEPRLGFKYIVSDDVRLKLAGGLYSQNLISTKSDRDVVNLFNGFLSAPSSLAVPDHIQSNHKLQKAIHVVTGVEWDIHDNFDINVEPYFKHFPQLISLNRGKLQTTDPDFMAESGNAYGIDFLGVFESGPYYLWLTYSLGYVTRNDGEQVYPPHYDRRHNMNVLASYIFGDDESWEASVRFNFGTGFPFTKTAGFWEKLDFEDGVSTDYLTQNGEIGILYNDTLNSGRLPAYHRLDISVKKIITFSKYSRMEIVGSITNAYNRANIFYFDRVRYDRVDQLPLLPSIGVNYSF